MQRLSFVLLLIVVSFSASGLCQINYAALEGTITDPQGKFFAGAEVELTSTSTRAMRRVASNDVGDFEISGLLPGDYELKVQAPGFAPLTRTVRLEVAQQMVLKLRINVASVKDVVDVDAVAPALHPTDSSVGEVIEPVAVHDLPLNGRMLIDLMLTVPGAHLSRGAQTGNMNPLY